MRPQRLDAENWAWAIIKFNHLRETEKQDSVKPSTVSFQKDFWVSKLWVLGYSELLFPPNVDILIYPHDNQRTAILCTDFKKSICELRGVEAEQSFAWRKEYVLCPRFQFSPILLTLTCKCWSFKEAWRFSFYLFFINISCGKTFVMLTNENNIGLVAGHKSEWLKNAGSKREKLLSCHSTHIHCFKHAVVLYALSQQGVYWAVKQDSSKYKL